MFIFNLSSININSQKSRGKTLCTLLHIKMANGLLMEIIPREALRFIRFQRMGLF